MSLTINGATNTLTAASGLTIAGNTAVTGTLSASGLANFTAATTSLSINGAGLNSVLALLLRNSTAGQASPGLQFYNGDGYRHYFQESAGAAGLTLTAQDGTPFNIAAVTSVTDTTDATSTTAASLKTAGGLGVAKKSYFGGRINTTVVETGVATTTIGNLTDYDATSTADNSQIAAAAFTVRNRGAVNQTATGNGVQAIAVNPFNYNTATVTQLTGIQVDTRNLSTGTVTAASGVRILAPSNSGGGTLSEFSAIDVLALSGATTNYAFQSRGAGLFKIGDTTDATSTSAAALVVSGGVGIAKKTYCGDNIVMASGKGIDFSATSNGSGTTTSEVLSDYEEGTWTPTLSGSGTAGSFTFTTQAGSYTKIGRSVTVNFTIVVNSVSVGATGTILIGGLPFTSNSTSSFRVGGSLSNISGIQLNGTAPMVELANNNTTFTLYGYNNNAAFGSSDASSIGAGEFLNGTITYHT